jgi:proline iminopeptidase
VDDTEAPRSFLELEPVARLGHSWGGPQALEYALRHPERVSHLILMNTVITSYDDCALFVRERNANELDAVETLRVMESHPGVAEGDDLEARDARYRVYFRSTLHTPGLLDRMMEYLRMGWSKEGFLAARARGNQLWRETYESTSYTLLPALTHLHIPPLALHGDYYFVPVACATHIAEADSRRSAYRAACQWTFLLHYTSERAARGEQRLLRRRMKIACGLIEALIRCDYA